MLPSNYDQLKPYKQEIILRNLFVSIAIEKGYTPAIPLFDEGIDLILVKSSLNRPESLIIQLKSRLTLDEKYYERGLHMGFYNHRNKCWYLAPYDELQKLMLEHTDIKDTESWLVKRKYTMKSVSKKNEKLISRNLFN